jgi:hypothetical protein
MPPEADVFRFRERERRQRDEERRHLLSMTVVEKTQHQLSKSRRIKVSEPEDRLRKRPAFDTGLGGTTGFDTAGLAMSQISQSAGPGTVPGATMDINRVTNGRREPVHVFIQRKKDIFLVQMSLEAKRAEIKALEERAAVRAAQLDKAEALLEADSRRFDAFLKDNDLHAVEAIKKADAETRARIERQLEIRKLNAQVMALKAEIAKCQENLSDSKQLRDFLESVSPSSWVAQQNERIAARRAEYETECSRRVKLAGEAAAAACLQANPSADEATVAAAVLEAESSMRDEIEAEDSGVDDCPLFFQEPQHLLDVFAQLESQNLFLIQNMQEQEAALDSLRAQYAASRAAMDSRLSTLSAQLDDLRGQISAVQLSVPTVSTAPTVPLNATGSGGAAPLAVDPEEELALLRPLIAAAYRETVAKESDERAATAAGDRETTATPADGDGAISCLAMLGRIEAALESLLSRVSCLPPADVEAAERAREHVRRSRLREAKLLEQKAQQEERIRRSLARAQAPVKVRQGKPKMYRSKLVKAADRERDEGPAHADDDAASMPVGGSFYSM